ncbi:glucosaminidase domain-containing protein [bacterium]|nr:glucosaminidase domain-containing protein [bacterium]
MLLHRQVQRRSLKRLVLSTVFVGLVFITTFGYGLTRWIAEQGEAHIALLQNMVLYTDVVAAESEIVIPDKYNEFGGDPRETELFLKKVAAVERFLKKYNAPLAANAEDFVRAADIYDIDYRLLPSIAMIESSGGKFLFRQYNPFGWGRSGYPSFTAAIYDVSRGMSRYYAGGLREPEKIAYRYNPVTPESWGRKARTFMNQMPRL